MNRENQARISVVIRMRDLESGMYDLLNMLSSQTIEPSQLVIVDNYSSKEKQKEIKDSLLSMKQELFKNHVQIKLIFLSDGEFSHPYSTNLGVHETDYELVCITNGHSLPISYTWLEDGIRQLKDPNVAAVGGFFYPSSKGLLKRLFYIAESPMKTITSVSTVNCIIRKSIWKKYPFDENLLKLIPETRKYGGEDYDWNLEMKSIGHKIVLDPKFSVVHFHEENFMLDIFRNLRNYFIFKKRDKQIEGLERPRKSYTKVNHIKRHSIEI